MATVRTGQADLGDGAEPAPPGSAAEAPARSLEVLFVLRSLFGYLRFYRSSLELLVERGHDVRLLIERDEHGEVEQRWVERMLERPNFHLDVGQHFGPKRWRRRRSDLRKGIEYVRVLHERVDPTTIHFRHRLRDVPPRLRRLTELPLLRSRAGLAALHGGLSALDRALGTPQPAVDYLAGLRPDVVALCDHGNVGSLHSDYAGAAKQLGIPVAMCVATWDNLSSRQRYRVQPDALLVWNPTQVREAVELHRVPEERVSVTGAPSFDDWFTWRPRPREEFLARVGLDPGRPVILWVGGALYKAERTEAEYAAAWVAELRGGSDPLLREAGVLLRPHPRRAKQWAEVDFSGLGNAVVWPPDDGTMPVDAERKADYFDSIYHAAAVVGLNTSAMIEAAIVGRPIVTVLDPDWHDSQRGTYHFEYLLEASGGPVRAVATLEEQLAELAAILAGGDADGGERTREFVRRFVRPNGLDRPATPIFAEALERAAELPVRPEPDRLWARALRRPVLAAFRLRDGGGGAR